MLSYRHGFHAGNHADVLKHWILTLCIDYLKQKEKPFHVIDTHAGAGRYSLHDKLALQTREAESGILALWPQRKELPEVFASYLALLEPDHQGRLKYYPGSPLLAYRQLRRGDRLRLTEQHNTELAALEKLFQDKRQVDVVQADGFAQLKAWLPPVTQRALVIIDPSYKRKSDYDAVIQALKLAVQRFPGGMYLLWYPLLKNQPVERMLGSLKTLAPNWLDVRLQIKAAPEGHGMYGSGMFLINPPWVLKEQLAQGLPTLVQRLGEDAAARFDVAVPS
jgi:23S rRNA (adenine2030-N6)-methyltransferase